MREILFRGKINKIERWFVTDIKVGDWAYGHFLEIPDAQILDKEIYFQVDPATVGQYTGLCDKNGVKIFEGDICNWKSTVYSNAVPYAVEYVVNDCRYVLKGTVDRIPILDELKIEVIGNIHDNPELVKEEAE